MLVLAIPVPSQGIPTMLRGRELLHFNPSFEPFSKSQPKYVVLSPGVSGLSPYCV